GASRNDFRDGVVPSADEPHTVGGAESRNVLSAHRDAATQFLLANRGAVNPPIFQSANGESVKLLVKRLTPAAVLPSYAHPGDAGLDLCAAVAVSLEPGESQLCGT